jgi:hypothetical protein
MPRITLDIDAPILIEVRALQEKEGRSMGRIVFELLAEALSQRKGACETPRLVWISRPMRSRVDLSDKEAVYARGADWRAASQSPH